MQLQIVETLQHNQNWSPKAYGFVGVLSEQDAERIFELLVAQDSYWNSYRKLIKVMPADGNLTRLQLNQLCEYVGKTDVYPSFHKAAQAANLDYFFYQVFSDPNDFSR